MTRLPRITGKDALSALLRFGFREIRATGSHHQLWKEGGKLVTVPIHSGEVLKPKTVKSICDQAGLTLQL